MYQNFYSGIEEHMAIQDYKKECKQFLAGLADLQHDPDPDMVMCKANGWPDLFREEQFTRAFARYMGRKSFEKNELMQTEIMMCALCAICDGAAGREHNPQG